jgi:hypothetical protein
MTVVISGDRIVALGKSDVIKPPDDAEVVEAAGKFLIPGLWDMHVHCYDKTSLPLFTANGVTGVRHMSGAPVHFSWRQEIADGSLAGPRMILGSRIVDGPKPMWPTSIAVTSEEEDRQAVLTAQREGYDFVKVYSLLPRGAYFAIAAEARKQKIPFAGRVPFSVSASEASEAGQKSLEPLDGLLLACSLREAELRKQWLDLLQPGASDPAAMRRFEYEKMRKRRIPMRGSSSRANIVLPVPLQPPMRPSPTITIHSNTCRQKNWRFSSLADRARFRRMRACRVAQGRVGRGRGLFGPILRSRFARLRGLLRRWPRPPYIPGVQEFRRENFGLVCSSR